MRYPVFLLLMFLAVTSCSLIPSNTRVKFVNESNLILKMAVGVSTTTNYTTRLEVVLDGTSTVDDYHTIASGSYDIKYKEYNASTTNWGTTWTGYQKPKLEQDKSYLITFTADSNLTVTAQ